MSSGAFSTPPSSPLKVPYLRAASIVARGRSLNPADCIPGFIEYITKKYTDSKKKSGVLPLSLSLANTTPGNVVENLITLMNAKGFPNLNMPILTAFTNSISNNPSYNRELLLSEISKWCGGNIPFEAAKARDMLSPAKFLHRLTMELDTNLISDSYDTASGRAITCTPEERDWIKDRTRGDTITKIEKKVCGTCYICDDSVYVFRYTTPKGYVYRGCGDKDHVLPPGVGNIYGVLFPSEEESMYYKDNPSIRESLKVCHSWCNVAKSGLIFISPPSPSQPTYMINEPAIEKMLETMDKWLKKGRDNHTGLDYSFHNKEPKDIEPFLNKVERKTRTTLGFMVTSLNSMGKPKGSNNIYTVHLLKIIFNSCIICKGLLFPAIPSIQKAWNMYGGQNRKQNKKQSGGVPFTLQLTEALANQCLAFIIDEECRDGDHLKRLDDASDKDIRDIILSTPLTQVEDLERQFEQAQNFESQHDWYRVPEHLVEAAAAAVEEAERLAAPDVNKHLLGAQIPQIPGDFRGSWYSTAEAEAAAIEEAERQAAIEEAERQAAQAAAPDVNKHLLGSEIPQIPLDFRGSWYSTEAAAPSVVQKLAQQQASSAQAAERKFRRLYRINKEDNLRPQDKPDDLRPRSRYNSSDEERDSFDSSGGKKTKNKKYQTKKNNKKNKIKTKKMKRRKSQSKSKKRRTK